VKDNYYENKTKSVMSCHVMSCLHTYMLLLLHVLLLSFMLGMDSWKRKQMHSHIYRDPQPFRNEVMQQKRDKDFLHPMVSKSNIIEYISVGLLKVKTKFF
jgi:hypothetical protein